MIVIYSTIDPDSNLLILPTIFIPLFVTLITITIYICRGSTSWIQLLFEICVLLTYHKTITKTYQYDEKNYTTQDECGNSVCHATSFLFASWQQYSSTLTATTLSR